MKEHEKCILNHFFFFFLVQCCFPVKLLQKHIFKCKCPESKWVRAEKMNRNHESLVMAPWDK